MTFPAIKSSSADSFIYYGEREGWHIALSQHRDSDALERSNWEVITADVLAVPDDPFGPYLDFGLADAAIERCSHWAVGWIEYLLVRPGSSAERRALEWREKLEQYPVADEDNFYALESAEEWCVRCDAGTREDHPSLLSDDGRWHCRKFRSAEDAREIQCRWENRP